MDERQESDERRRSPTTTARSGEVWIDSEDDILRARQQARSIAEDIGLSITDVTRTVTAVSELARNVFLYADEGVMKWREIEDGPRVGIELVFEDDGPGIDDVDGVLRADHSTSNGMGRGIQGTKKLMDDFELTSSAEKGTTILIRKWR
ncbi:anti-sigma regulatory factor [Haloarculaceae archaeon H-GB2-1]|nr:anti-sigma regulatory factor [Haloarculaceae archaeon H-GB1-1]MEA5387868.1 anti-sigma regulatory factor [Haloarculaceae archaeon H-GB11]MEA5409362.1 anti-sigma regulatory factor [Haloarculaceae archaeon H-GB2-1]